MLPFMLFSWAVTVASASVKNELRRTATKTGSLLLVHEEKNFIDVRKRQLTGRAPETADQLLGISGRRFTRQNPE